MMVKSGIADGKATLLIIVKDYSWRGWFKGNAVHDEKEIIIDTKPPEIHVLTRFHNIAQGGSGLLIYRLSEPCLKTGVYIDEDFFPGYSGHYKDPDIFLSFFALDYKKGPGSKLFVQAMDNAGNSSKTGFSHYIKKKSFKKDIINISDNFLNCKMPEFESEILPGSGVTMKEKFIAVNRKLRLDSYEKIYKAADKASTVLNINGLP